MAGLLKGKVAIVTGGSKGIGYSVAERFTKEGAKVVISSRNKEELEVSAKKLNCDYFALDVSDSKSIESIISKKLKNQSLLYASKALKILNENYINFLKNPKKNNAYNMSLGAHYAGKAISISKTTAPHALSYPFTSHFSIPHGHAVSLTFNQILTYNFY